MKSDKPKKILDLFLSMLYISSFTFGGGFVMITLMKKRFVDRLKLVGEDEILDMTAIAQSSPGAIAVNAAILIGWRVAGFAGMIAAVLGTIIPPMVILTVISFFYDAFASNAYVTFALKGMQAGVAAVIMNVVFDLGGKVVKTRKIMYIAMMAAAFIASFVFNINVIWLILMAILIGIVYEVAMHKRRLRNDIS